jgi:uncharacterized protein
MPHLPLFPLNTVLFPGMPLFLHIFEPRYRLMTNTCIENESPFGVVLIHEGMEALGPLAVPYKTGTTARIVQVEKLEDGVMNITAVGVDRFQIIDTNLNHPYLTGKVETLPLENVRPLEILRGMRRLYRQVHTYLRLISQIDPETIDLSQIEMPDDPVQSLYLAASLLQLPSVEKQPLLEIDQARVLAVQLQRLYRREIVLLNPRYLVGEERARRSSWLN